MDTRKRIRDQDAAPMDTTTERTTTLMHDERVFQIRVWRSHAADGWFWTVEAEDHPYRRTSSRVWVNARTATEAAQRHIPRTFPAV